MNSPSMALNQYANSPTFPTFQVAYFGKPQDAPGFFCNALENFGVNTNIISQDTIEDVVNPADLLLDLLTKETNQEKIIKAYCNSQEPKQVLRAVERANKKAKRLGEDNVYGE